MADRDLSDGEGPRAALRPRRPLLAPARGLDATRLGVVLVNFRQPAYTIECLESLLRIPQPFRIVVVENGSGDGSLERIRAWAAGREPYAAPPGPLAALTMPPVPKPVALVEAGPEDRVRSQAPRLALLDARRNLGFAGGNNAGTRYLLGDPAIDRIWYLNNDAVADPRAVEALLRAFEADPRIGIVGTVIRNYEEPGTIQALGGQRFNWLTGNSRAIGAGETALAGFDPKKVVDETGFVVGASLAVSRAFYETVGPMSEAYFLYYEEIDWMTRNAGRFRTGFARGAVVWHRQGGSIGSSRKKGQRSELSEYYLVRSRLLFYLKHRPWLFPLVWAQVPLLILRRLLRRQPAKAFRMMKAMFFLPY
ncbi:glycosyltransferase [Thermaurantiacus sp.]